MLPSATNEVVLVGLSTYPSSAWEIGNPGMYYCLIPTFPVAILKISDGKLEEMVAMVYSS